MSWGERAACSGLPVNRFFNDVWPDEETLAIDEEAFDRARSVCASCPVRLNCFEAAMIEEGGSAVTRRWGVRGGVTPAQRYSIWRRDASACEQCSETFDPLGLVEGEVVCSCGDFTEPPIPLDGDTWYPRHDALLKRLIDYLLERTKPGDRILPPYRMLLELGHRRKDDLPLCYDRLIADGLILRGEGRGEYYRAAGKQALADWAPFLRRRNVA